MSVEIKFIGTKEVAEALGCSLTGRRKEGYEHLKHLHNI